MMTVRFPSGVSIQYNTANYVVRRDGYTDLYTAKDGSWVAQVPTPGCVIEVAPACRVYDATTDPESVTKALLRTLEGGDRGRLSCNDIARIKAALGRFDARRRRWK